MRPVTADRAAILAASFVLAGLLAGCAADSPVVENLLVDPGFYDTLNCTDLVREFQSNENRVKELTPLMEKSGAGAGGTVVNALAYNTDYAKARAASKYAEAAARRKGCNLAIKVEPKKPDAAPLGPAMPDFGTPKTPGRF
jgi:hypothetical protein